MTLIADRGLFVRLLVSSGKFEAEAAGAFADALDAAAREPATKADLTEVRTEIAAVKTEVALLSQRVDALGTRLDGRIDAQGAQMEGRIDALGVRLDGRIDALGDKLLLRLGGLMIALTGALFAALRLTQP